MNDHLFGKELFILFAASAFRKLSSIYVFSYFPFGFEGRIWDLIVSVPDHCLSFYLLNHQTNDVERANAIQFKETEENLDKKIAELNNKLLLEEKEDRKCNLFFYGLHPREHENVYE